MIEMSGESVDLKHIDLSRIKSAFSLNFPNNPLLLILSSEPDQLSLADFVAKAGTWLAILDAEKKRRYKYLNEQIKGDAQWG